MGFLGGRSVFSETNDEGNDKEMIKGSDMKQEENDLQSTGLPKRLRGMRNRHWHLDLSNPATEKCHGRWIGNQMDNKKTNQGVVEFPGL